MQGRPRFVARPHGIGNPLVAARKPGRPRTEKRKAGQNTDKEEFEACRAPILRQKQGKPVAGPPLGDNGLRVDGTAGLRGWSTPCYGKGNHGRGLPPNNRPKSPRPDGRRRKRQPAVAELVGYSISLVDQGQAIGSQADRGPMIIAEAQRPLTAGGRPALGSGRRDDLRAQSKAG